MMGLSLEGDDGLVVVYSSSFKVSNPKIFVYSTDDSNKQIPN